MTGTIRVDRPADIDAFLDRAGALLLAHEAEHCLILGIAGNLQKGTTPLRQPPRLALALEDAADGRLLAAAIQTPPYNLVVSMVDDLDAVDALATAFVAEDLPGVNGPPEVAARFVEVWTGRTGRRARREMAQRIFRLSTVRSPRSTPGSMRLAEPTDRALLIAWIEAFSREALATVESADEAVDRWIARQGRTLYVWEDGDVRVSLCGVGAPTTNGIRVGPVYTPPEHRGHGYASNLVAQVSQAQLDAGRRFVTLFTDLANPTSNRIYTDIGYEATADFDQYAFGEP
jgi:predicted GNAT family acetyltransferase